MSQNKPSIMEKPKLILDLDQTIISAEVNEEYDFKKHKKKAVLFDFYDMDGYYIVFVRPGLQKFLDYAFENFDVSVWTAATKDYAVFIIDKIILSKPGRKLDWIFFSYHCEISERAARGTKDLSMLWNTYKLPGFNKNNTVILDDYDEVHDIQPGNCIPAHPFFFTDKGSDRDNFLTKLIPALKVVKKHIQSGGKKPALKAKEILGTSTGTTDNDDTHVVHTDSSESESSASSSDSDSDSDSDIDSHIDTNTANINSSEK